eukprot:Gb_14942 [translate_table: standard]
MGNRRGRRSLQTKMKTPWLFILSFGILFLQGSVESSKPSAMFVFGDSYVDTGNHDKAMISWKPPYGSTFPGKPTGRHSDGRVLTDFVAAFFNMSTPVPYNQRNEHPNMVPFGINFASGGSGVFDTYQNLPSASAQIDQLEKLIGAGLYPAQKFASSLVLFSVSGNDYGFYLVQKRSITGLLAFEKTVINQLEVDLERLYKMGFRKFAVTNMGPLGCLPSFTFRNSYKYCNDTINQVASYHNVLLGEAVKGFTKTRPDASMAILDQYASSISILQHSTQYGRFKEPLTPCCTGACGVDDNQGRALYSVCPDPETAFFWDVVHPTQAAWQALMKPFSPSLHPFKI